MAHTPYRSALSASIAEISELALSSELVERCTEATAEIARFDTELGSEIAPFATLLLRLESAASSRIENLTASAKAIALAELGDPRRANATIIVSNTRAMQAAIDLAGRLDGPAIIKMHEALLGDSHPEWVGHWRTEAVWIGGGNFSPQYAAFVAPHHDRVPAAIADLVAFIGRNDLNAIAQTAIAHAQFETIHPFPDGNGRTGRSLIHALLRAKGVTRNVTVPVSSGLLVDTAAYFDALRAYRDGDPEPIVGQLVDASFHAIVNGRELVRDVESVRDKWQSQIRARRGATAWRLAELLIHQPVVDSALVQARLGVTAPTADAAIARLIDDGVLVKVSGDRRYRKWAANDVLDGFAKRPGRRGIATRHP